MKNNSQTDCLFLHIPDFNFIDYSSYELWVNKIAMGVFSMCNELERNNFNPEIIHYGMEKVRNWNFDIAEYVKFNNIKAVAISLHWHYQTYDSLITAKKIKEKNPDTFIFLGGYTSSAFAEDIMKKYNFIDAVIKGEGEKPVVELMQKLSSKDDNLSNVSNLFWRKDGSIVHNENFWFANKEELNSYNFNGLKFLNNTNDFLHLPIKILVNNNVKNIYLDPESSIICCLGRGCPGNCTWCGGGFNAVKKITGRNCVTLRDPKIVAEEILNFKKEYNLDEFYICYDPFPDNQEYLLEMFEILGEKMPKQILITFENFGLPTKKFIDSFVKNLHYDSRLIISPEFGNEILRKNHKGESFSYSNNEFFEALDYIDKKNIKCTLFFTQLPNTSEYNQNLTKMMMTKIKSLYKNNEKIKINFIPISDIEPYSPWALNPEKYGIVNIFKTLEDYIENTRLGREAI